ncbi:hypothetical protein DSO57_1012743 [Entomophthora muscae]|uniref:Uncharacterized protein n=1 Tax=Entomophthora muscae TaxID=34485 RepID=A0ACC2SUV1_9FUNG|nr:hypothetical protein DSO57_1012743 [Entomophthora muscae]
MENNPMILSAVKFVVFSLAPFLLLLWSTSSDFWGEISSSAWLVGKDPSSLWGLSSGLLFSGGAVVKRLTCNDLDLDTVDHTLLASKGDVSSMPPLPSAVKSNPVPLVLPKVSSPAPSCTPWFLTGLMLMGLNAYFPQLSPVFSLWSPLQAAVPVLHWKASWWFVLLGWEPNLVSLAPSLTISLIELGLLSQLWDLRVDALHPSSLFSLNWLCQCSVTMELSSPVSFLSRQLGCTNSVL